MTLTQLQYVTAVAEYGSFKKAAEACYVTQPTLSMQIKKIEDFFEVQIFDRSKKPLRPTEVGQLIIEQAKIGLGEIEKINRIVDFSHNKIPTTLRIGIIPTLCPYLTPLFLSPLSKKYPTIQIEIKELTTKELFNSFNEGQIDLGILIEPEQQQNSLIYSPIFQEPLVGYIAESHPLFYKNKISPDDINKNGFWLIEDCHCLHNQILDLCDKIQIDETDPNDNNYRVGGLETVRRMVEMQYGYTVLPQLVTNGFDSEQLSRIRKFQNPMPAREVSLVRDRNFSFDAINSDLIDIIKGNLPEEIKFSENEEMQVLALAL